MRIVSLYFFMHNTVHTYIERYNLLTGGKPVLVGLSGGADSVVLLSVLCKLGYDCIAAHCNFNLRGEESQRDEAFCEALTEMLSVPLHKISFNTNSYAKEKRISIEMAARDLRYEWFEKLRQETDAQAIAIAHHQEDSTETLMINLCRGTGIRGLTGIRPKNGFVVRPLLSITKNEIMQWVAEKGLSYVTDSTNLTDIYTRNHIRHNIIPLLEKVNPSAGKNIAKTTEYLSEVEKIYLYAIDNIRKKVITKEGFLSITPLLASPAPETVLYELLKPYGFNSSTVANIYTSLDKESGRTFYSPTHRLIKDREYLQLTTIEVVNQDEYLIQENDDEFNNPINLSFHKEDITKDFVIEKNKNIAFFDYNKIKYPLVLRRWKKGDWFIPFGMNGKKKLSDYFSDAKYSLIDKENVWLLCSGEDIIWVIGERPDDRFCIKKDSSKALIVHFF